MQYLVRSCIRSRSMQFICTMQYDTVRKVAPSSASSVQYSVYNIRDPMCSMQYEVVLSRYLWRACRAWNVWQALWNMEYLEVNFVTNFQFPVCNGDRAVCSLYCNMCGRM